MCGRGGGKGKRESGGGREGKCSLNCTWIECNMYQHMISLHTTVCPTQMQASCKCCVSIVYVMHVIHIHP